MNRRKIQNKQVFLSLFAERVREVRVNIGCNQKEFGKMLGELCDDDKKPFSQSIISDAEKHGIVGLPLAMALSKISNRPVSDFRI